MTLITPPPPAPNRADPATFPDRADAYVAWWATVASEINALTPGDLGAVSLTGNQTVAGVKTFSDATLSAAFRAAAADSASAPGHSWQTDTNTGMFRVDAGAIGFSTGGTERGRMVSGDFRWGQSLGVSQPGVSNSNVGASIADNGRAYFSSGGTNISVNHTGTGTVIACRQGGDSVGSISVSATNTSFNTSSDYRLKDEAPDPEGWDAAEQAQAIATTLRHYTWKSSGELAFGAFAHELAEVAPQAVVGEKDAVDDDGNIVPQGVDWSKLVPVLAAALAQALHRIEVLEAAQ